MVKSVTFLIPHLSHDATPGRSENKRQAKFMLWHVDWSKDDYLRHTARRRGIIFGYTVVPERTSASQVFVLGQGLSFVRQRKNIGNISSGPATNCKSIENDGDPQRKYSHVWSRNRIFLYMT